MKKKIDLVLSYIVLFVWMCLIFYFSAQEGTLSGAESGGLIRFILNILSHILRIDITESDVLAVIADCGLWIRKCAHFTEYYILGLLMTNALRFTLKGNKNFPIILILLCFIYALSDELHQVFIPGRVGNIFDALIDLSGSYAGIMTYMICEKYKEVKFYFSELIINFMEDKK